MTSRVLHDEPSTGELPPYRLIENLICCQNGAKCMPDSIAIRKPHPRLSDPAEFQRPLTFYAEIVRRHWEMIAVLSIALTALVALGCALAPAINVGSALIAIDRQAVPETIGSDHLMTTGDDQFMATQQSLLQADTILRPVAERYNLLEREHQLRRYWFWRYSREKEAAIRNAPIVLKHLKVDRNPNTYLLTITYRDTDPQVAANVANAIADSYLREIFETRTREAGRLTSSMERQLIDLKQKMESTHNALMVYQRDLGTADPEQKTSVLVARLQALNTENSAAEADRIAKEAVYREAKDGSLPEVEVSGQSNDLSKDVEKLQVAKANLALVGATYGDQHPEYRKAAAQVEEASAALDESRRNVATRIGVDYRQTLVRERMLSAAVAETKQQVDDLTSQSFDYLQLKHEADAAERVYEDLFAKIKQSGINSELQNNIIRLADSARPAAKPVFPNWPLIIGVLHGLFLSCLRRIFCLRGTDRRDCERDRADGRGAGHFRGLRIAPGDGHASPVGSWFGRHALRRKPLAQHARRFFRRGRTPSAGLSDALDPGACAQERVGNQRLPGRRKIDPRALAGDGQRGTRQTHALDRRRPAPTGD